jgi:hypothetical protein
MYSNSSWKSSENPLKLLLIKEAINCLPRNADGKQHMKINELSISCTFKSEADTNRLQDSFTIHSPHFFYTRSVWTKFRTLNTNLASLPVFLCFVQVFTGSTIFFKLALLQTCPATQSPQGTVVVIPEDWQRERCDSNIECRGSNLVDVLHLKITFLQFRT